MFITGLKSAFDNFEIENPDDIIDAEETVEVKGFNKSKAKKTIVDKIKRFYYIHLYEKIKIKGSNDEIYKEELAGEIADSEVKKEKINEKATKKVDKIASQKLLATDDIERMDYLVQNADERTQAIDEKIDKLNEKLENVETMQPIPEPDVAEQTIENTNEEIKQEVNQIADDTTIENQIDAVNQDLATQVDEMQPEVTLESDIQAEPVVIEPVEVQEMKKEGVDKNTSEHNSKIEGIKTTSISKIEDIITTMYENIRKEEKDFYDKKLNEVVDNAKNILIENNNHSDKVIANLKDDKNKVEIEKNNYKSLFETEKVLTQKQTGEINSKNQTIDELNNIVINKDQELANLRAELALLQEKNNDLTSKNGNLKITVATLMSEGITKEEADSLENTDEKTR